MHSTVQKNSKIKEKWDENGWDDTISSFANFFFKSYVSFSENSVYFGHCKLETNQNTCHWKSTLWRRKLLIEWYNKSDQSLVEVIDQIANGTTFTELKHKECE